MVKTLLILALVLFFAAPASAGWTKKSDGTGVDIVVPLMSSKGGLRTVFYVFSSAADSPVFRIGDNTRLKVCVNANTGGEGANAVVAQLYYFHNRDDTLSYNDASPVLGITLTGEDGEDCMYDNDPGFYRIRITSGPTANSAYVSLRVTDNPK